MATLPAPSQRLEWSTPRLESLDVKRSQTGNGAGTENLQNLNKKTLIAS